MNNIYDEKKQLQTQRRYTFERFASVRSYIKSSSNKTFCITNKDGWYIPRYWSPDNKKLNCSQLVTLTDYVIWLLNIENGEK